MKKQIRQISEFAVRVTVCGLILGVFCTTFIPAQTETLSSQKSDVWVAHYWVHVKGKFTVEPELGSGNPERKYVINREYEGHSNLVFDHYKADDPTKAIRYPKPVEQYPQFIDSSPGFHITINDSKILKYEEICGSYDTVEETWNADVSRVDAGRDFPGFLLIDNAKHSYETLFPLYFLEPADHKHVKHVVIKMSHSDTGATKAEKPLVEALPFNYFLHVKDFIENTVIRRHSAGWLELKLTEGDKNFRWCSELLHPDIPLFEGVPESKDKVEIRICYNLSKN